MYKGNGDFMKKRMKDERGSLIVEATIVFPVTFLVVIFCCLWGICIIREVRHRQFYGIGY